MDRAGVHIDTAGDVDGDHRDTCGLDGVEHRGGGRPQRTGSGYPHDTVDHQIRCSWDISDQASTRASKRRQSLGVGPLRIEQDCAGRHAPAAQEGRGPQRVPAVVPGADHRAHRAAGHRAATAAKLSGDGDSQP